MSLNQKTKIQCDNCGKTFNVPIWESVNCDLNPELRGKIIDGTIFNYECPHCKTITKLLYPLLYHDMKNKFMIQYGDFNNLIFEWANMDKNTELKGLLNNEQYKDYKMFGVSDVKDLPTFIIALENNLNPYVCQIMGVLGMMEISEAIKTKIQAVLLDYYEGEIVQVFYGEDGQGRVVNFDKNIYGMISDRFSNELAKIPSYCFDGNAALEFLDKYEDVKKGKTTKFQLAFIESYEQKNTHIAYIPNFNFSKFKSGDDIVFTNYESEYYVYGRIVGISDINVPFFPKREEELDRVLWKKEIVNIGYLYSEEPDDNEDFREAVVKYKKSDCSQKSMPLDFMDYSTAYLITDDLGSPISQYDKERDGKVLNVYLNKKDIKIKDVSLIPCKFKDIITYVFKNPDKFDGIVINPEGERVIFTDEMLLCWIYERTMMKRDRMVELIQGLNEKEIEYIGEFEFGLIKSVYLERKTPKMLGEELKMSENDVQSFLQKGYNKIKIILQDTYL